MWDEFNCAVVWAFFGIAFLWDCNENIKYKRHWIAKAVIRKKKGAGGISLPNFRLYCKATVINKVWYRHKDRNIYQRNNIENPEINPHIYVYLIFEEYQISLLLTSIFSSTRAFSNESVVHIRWPNYWSFSFSISPSNENLGLISFRIDWFDLAAQGTLKSLLQHHSSKASILQCSAFCVVQLSHPSLTSGKTIVLTKQTLVTKWCFCLCWP